LSRLSCPRSDLHAASGARLIHNQAAQIRDIPCYPLGPCRARFGVLSRQAWGPVAPTRVIHWGLVAHSYLYKNLIVTYRVKNHLASDLHPKGSPALPLRSYCGLLLGKEGQQTSLERRPTGPSRFIASPPVPPSTGSRLSQRSRKYHPSDLGSCRALSLRAYS
jgi:hypothetical protein